MIWIVEVYKNHKIEKIEFDNYMETKLYFTYTNCRRIYRK